MIYIQVQPKNRAGSLP